MKLSGTHGVQKRAEKGVERQVEKAAPDLPADSRLRKLPGVPSEPPRKKFLGLF